MWYKKALGICSSSASLKLSYWDLYHGFEDYPVIDRHARNWPCWIVCMEPVATWLFFSGAANYEIGAPGIFCPRLRPPSEVKIFNIKLQEQWLDKSLCDKKLGIFIYTKMLVMITWYLFPCNLKCQSILDTEAQPWFAPTENFLIFDFSSV